MQYTITSEDLSAALHKIGLSGKQVAVHSSLSSFGYVEGGAGTVIQSLQECCRSVMMPAFCWDSNAPPPSDDRPETNGCDYGFYDNWDTPPKPFIIQKAGINPKMGAIACAFLSMPGVDRSDHAWHSWACWGKDAQWLSADHDWNTANLPLERLSRKEGRVVLIGVGLSACTAIHIAEEYAGRRPFIRWATDKTGVVRRVRAAGCANGFDRLYPKSRHLFRQVQVGRCRILTARLDVLIDHMARLIKASPESGQCSPDCIRCRDAVLGGPPA